jgi:tetratricopeptide (TPR) repeat protein
MSGAETVDWFTALLVLGIGLSLGTAAVLLVAAASRRAGRAAAALPLPVRDLAGKRDVLLRQLREMEDTASKRTPEQLARERYALELEAAGVLLALGERLPQEGSRRAPKGRAAASAHQAPAEPTRAGLRGFLWGTGSATAILLVAFFVYQSAKPRDPGGSVTGDAAMSGRSGSAGAAADAEEARIKAALARNPADTDARLALAQIYFARQDWMGVWNETSRVLEREPGNPPALAYQAVVRMAMGQNDVAVGLLSRALAADPDLVDAYTYLALGYLRMGRPRDAEATMTRASTRFPDRAPEFRQLLAEMKKQEPAVASSGSPSGAPDPHAGLGTPGAETQAGQPAGRSGGRRVSGTIDVDPSVRNRIAPGAVLFVFAREAGAVGGPPVAVKRLSPTFPAVFELSESDSMMGQPFPDTLVIEARLDSDGDPTTRSPTDPKARVEQVKAGRSDVHLVLR